MMKRILVLLLALLLIIPAARAEGDLYGRIGAAIYTIVRRSDAGEEILGSGVLFGERDQLLTAAGCCREGDLYAVGGGRESRILSYTSYGAAALATLETPADAQPLPLATKDAQTLPYLFGVDGMGTIGTSPLYAGRLSMSKDGERMLLNAAEGLMPGAFVTDESGALVGLVVAQHMEGMGSYEAIDANSLHALFSGSAMQSKPSVSWQDGEMTVSWAGDQESGVYALSLSGGENLYYSSFEVYGNTTATLAVPPGHTYLLQADWAAGPSLLPAPTWENAAVYTVPALPYTDHAFQMDCYLASTPKGVEPAGALEPMALTAAALADPACDVYLQVRSSYRVAEEIVLPMTVELIAPDGQFYFEEMSFIFDPALGEDDSFAVPVGELIDNCNTFSGGLRTGEYLVRCAIGGRIAGEYAFTLQEAGEIPAAAEEETEPAKYGVIPGLQAEEKSGVVIVDWANADVPEGATVTLYSMCAGNPYYNYQEYENNAPQAEVFCVPGRRMMIWAVWALEHPETPPMPSQNEEFVLMDVPAAAPLTENGFRNIRLGVAPSKDPEAEGKGAWLKEIPLTREILTDRSTPLYFQTEDTYQVGATSEGHPLSLILLTPEGFCFLEPGYYIYDAALQASDLWLRDISALFAAYESICGDAAWPAGEYRLQYLIDGRLAGEYAFTLE